MVSTTNQDHAAFDQTEYTVRLVPMPFLRKEAIIDLSAVLNISVADTRERMNEGKPIAEDLTAMEAMRLRKEFSLRGIEVAFTPPLEWKDDGTSPQ
ncbi:hypothetical protein [Phyllobacterium sp. SB3]|uniref:hypothetical protein n=1 Tax=Phyllobacterium sp. SB3 TaxID=3156073 RepID=UPI0032AFA845